MLTVDLDRLGVTPGDRVLDLGCGAGRHSFALYRRGARVVALDRAAGEVGTTREWLAAMHDDGEHAAGAGADPLVGDAYRLPFADESVDAVVAAEILEHLPHDETAIDELARVLRPGGRVAVTVPRWGPERVCWALSEDYHRTEGGHVRIYRRRELVGKLERGGLEPTGRSHAHALHAPYWWLRCLVGPDRDGAWPVRAYRRLLEWDIERRPLVTRLTERALDPLIGKSLVVYLTKPEGESVRAAA